jgi:hypothetical protein
MQGVALVGSRTYSYDAFKASDGRTIDGGTKYFVFVVEPGELGEPFQVTVDHGTYETLREGGFGTRLDVKASAFAKNNRLEWRAMEIVVHDTGENLRAVG